MAAVALGATAPSWATSHLAEQLPSLPQSCNTCHESGPGSARNAFGLQAEDHLTGDGASGTVDWPSLCVLDADTDGSTNGEELGDPCCVFAPGETVSLPTSDPNSAASISTNTCPDHVDAGVEVDAGGTSPVGWSCAVALFANGACDCGCGVVDADCADDSYHSCAFNACAGGVVDVVDPTTCVAREDDSTWRCGFQAYADGAVCDCGCGAPDPDCQDASVASCDASGCGVGQIVDETNTTRCTSASAASGARPGWWCPAEWYASGDDCDCGCGLVDPDCPRAPQVADCRQHGCELSPVGAGATVDGRDVSQCVLPASPPPGWTCDAAFYGAFDGCDCGCGVADPDCPYSSFAYCEQSGCPDGLLVDENDATACVSPPALGCTSSPAASLGGALLVGIFIAQRRRRPAPSPLTDRSADDA